MSRTINTIVMRPPMQGAPIVAVIEAEVIDDWCKDWDHPNKPDGQLLQECLTFAVTAWFERSEHGRRAMFNSCYEFQIGDLKDELAAMGDMDGNPEELSYYIKRQGILKLDIKVFEEPSGRHYWDYDDELIDQDEVNEQRSVELGGFSDD